MMNSEDTIKQLRLELQQLKEYVLDQAIRISELKKAKLKISRVIREGSNFATSYEIKEARETPNGLDVIIL